MGEMGSGADASVSVTMFATSHDAASPSGFAFSNGNEKICVCTDLGFASEEVENALAGSTALLIEANHDPYLLKSGAYPYILKKRILGEKGHLSNEACGKLISKIWHPSLKHILLGHLSEENNLPEVALKTVREILADTHPDFENFTKIKVAERDKITFIL